MNDRWFKLIKIFWLPVLLIIMIAAEPYLGVWKSQYWLEYLVLQIILLVLYAYILYKDGQAIKEKAMKTNANVKGKRKK